MSQECVLCREPFRRERDKYLVKGKSKLNLLFELESLPFSLNSTSPFICRDCVQKLKKRRNWIDHLIEIDTQLASIPIKSCTKPQILDLKRNLVDTEVSPKRPRGDKEPHPFVHSSPVKQISDQRSTGSKTPCSIAAWPVSPVRAVPCLKKPETEVFVKVKWPSKDGERKLPSDLESLGKMLVRGTYKQIAAAAWRNVFLKRELQLLINDFDKLMISPIQLANSQTNAEMSKRML